jgi:CubicO group peptidase (beta-lactamase class C family)
MRIVALVLCLASGSISAADLTLTPRIESFIRRQQLPGFAIGIVRNGRVVYARGFGVDHLGKDARPITTRTLFHMASITKPFVATAVMQLAERGKVDLDAPVSRYVPYFRQNITVRQMLTHTSGMPDVEDYEWSKPQYDDGALERYVRSIAGAKPLFPPGDHYEYSNMAYEVLGDLVAKVSGQPFESYVQRNILGPARMRDSTLLVREAKPKLLAWGHERDANGKVFPSDGYPYNRAHTPSSNLHSNVEDMLRWATLNMKRGSVLRRASYDAMWTPAARVPDRDYSVGLSWFIGDYRGHRAILHSGADTGFQTSLVMLPDDQIAVVWMTNGDWLERDARLEITHAALDAALDPN